MIKTLANTIIWYAQEQLKSGLKCQDVNSAIHGVLLDVGQILMDYMAKQDKKCE